MGFYLVSCHVISRPATMKGWEKGLFWKICALGNLKCNKSDNIIGYILEKIPEINCIESELVQEDFSSILLKLQVASVYSSEIVKTDVLQNIS